VLTVTSPQQVTLYIRQLNLTRALGCFPASTAAIAISDPDGPPLLLSGMDPGDNFFVYPLCYVFLCSGMMLYKQQFIFSGTGKQLLDERTLADYNIGNEFGCLS